MRNVFASLLLAWLASVVNVGLSSSTPGASSPSLSSSTRDLGTTSSKVRSTDNYDQEDEMVIPRLRHRLRQDISSRLEARGILFDKMERPRRRRRYSRRPPFFIGSPFRYEARYAGGFGPYYRPYGKYEVNPYEEFPDEMDDFFTPPLSSLYYQSPQRNNRPSSSYYRPQAYNPSGQPSYYSDQFMTPQQMEPTQARPYYRGETPVSSRRRPQNVAASYQPERVSPYYPSQTPQPNSQLSSPYYYNPPTPISMGQENSRRPIQRQPTRPGYSDESNVQPLRPNTEERPMQFPGPRVNSERLPQPTAQGQFQARPSYSNESNVQPPVQNAQGRPLRTSTQGTDSEQRAPTVSQQPRPNYRDDSNLRPPGLNREGRPELTSAARQQPIQSAIHRPSRNHDNEFNDQSPVLNSISTPQNHEQTTNSRLEHGGAIPDYHVDSSGQNTQVQYSPTSGVRPELDQDARSRAPGKTWVPSDRHDEVQPQSAVFGQSSLPRVNAVQPKADESKNGQVPLKAGPTFQKSFEESKPVESTQKTD